MQAYFHQLAAWLDGRLQPGEDYRCRLAAENSDFVRFNRSAIRQAGQVRQINLSLELMRGLRHAEAGMTMSGDAAQDRDALQRMLGLLRNGLDDLPEDPHLLRTDAVRSSERILPSRLPDRGAIVDAVLTAAQGRDLVGILAAGPIYRGFADSAGQRNWHEAASFNLDWSLYHGGDKAVKRTYAGFAWDEAAFAAMFRDAETQLDILARPPAAIAPGAYRAYLAPAALNEVLGMLNWGGVSEKALRTRQSPLRRMREEGLALHPQITLAENTEGGLAPAFQEDGFIKPPRVPLIEHGRLTGSLVSPRSAKEYGIAANGADAGEGMRSIELDGGTLPAAGALAELGTGVYIGNLWYLNFSDRANCRLTGMTRFATFWVEDGRIKAPLNVMRFDDGLFRMLGEGLLGLTREREMLIDTDTYGARSTASALLPGALIDGFRFVL